MTKQPVWLWIPKFGEQVLIDPDHPLAMAAAELPPRPDQSEEVAADEQSELPSPPPRGKRDPERSGQR